MTLGQFLDYLSSNPLWLILYFGILPITALLAWIMGKGEGEVSPWCNLYATLVYLTSIPGIFAIALTLYLTIFRKESLLNVDLYTQILPIISMVFTLILIGKNVSFDSLPGFKKLSGLMLAIGAIMILMYVLDKMRLIVFSYLPFSQLLIFFLVLLVIAVFGISRFMKSKN